MKNCADCEYMRTVLPVKANRINFTGGVASCGKNHFQDEGGAGKMFRLYRDKIPKGWVEAEHCADFTKVDFIKEILELSNKKT